VADVTGRYHNIVTGVNQQLSLGREDHIPI